MCNQVAVVFSLLSIAEKCISMKLLDQMFLGVVGGMKRLSLVSDFFLAPA